MNEESRPKINYSKSFLKQLKKAPIQIKETFRAKFALFLKDPFHVQLNNHSLAGKYLGYRSINITGDWRALYSEYLDEEGTKIVIFEILGTHSQLYR